MVICKGKIINIMERTTNFVDGRLIGHGKRVAYLVFKILKKIGVYTNEQLRDICVLAMLHDVGAYKKEEIDVMVLPETVPAWEHAIYGYLFLKYFSPLQRLAPAVLYHHADCNEIDRIESSLRFLAQLMSICDRADVFYCNNKNADDFREHIEANRGIKYEDSIVDMYIRSRVNIDSIYKGIDSNKEFERILYKLPLTQTNADEYIKMIINTIDFRSKQTVIHTNTTACIAGMLSRWTGAGEKEIMSVKTGAMLHDIGKTGVPVHILESTGRLNVADMKIMRTHVEITEKILEGNVSGDVMSMAIKHHERLNKSGYPNRLDARDISTNDQIVTIADIFSALCEPRSYNKACQKERIIKIISDLSTQNMIDPHIAAMTVDRFDELYSEAAIESEKTLHSYHSLNNEFMQLIKGKKTVDNIKESH